MHNYMGIRYYFIDAFAYNTSRRDSYTQHKRYYRERHT